MDLKQINDYVNWFFIFISLFYLFWGKVSLCSPGYPWTCADQAGIELLDSPASAFRVLRWKACATTPNSFFILI